MIAAYLVPVRPKPRLSREPARVESRATRQRKATLPGTRRSIFRRGGRLPVPAIFMAAVTSGDPDAPDGRFSRLWGPADPVQVSTEAFAGWRDTLGRTVGL